MTKPHFTFVLGGAASGKSAHAEALVRKQTASRVYIATAQAFDTEMRARVAHHVAQRGAGWTTIEAPFDAADRLRALNANQTCLLDCATMWLSNQMLAEADLEQEQADLVDAVRHCAATLVVVSNEVGHGIVPDNAMARRFREAQGRLNIALAQAADAVVLVTAGLPQILKGKP